MRFLLPFLLLLAGCREHFTPLQNRIAVGKEAYVVFAADGQGGQGDLYAVDANGGVAYPFTYSLASESHPALDPTGVMLAFVRAPSDTGGTPTKLWVMNLLNGNERELPLGDGVVPRAAAWSRDGRTIYARTSNGIWSVAVPPAAPAPRHLGGSDSLTADSALTVLVGDPPFARIAPCREGVEDLCAVPAAGAPQVVDSPAHGPFRWGSDSLAYFVGDRMLVRSVGPGRPREIRIERAPGHLRDATWFPGLRPGDSAGN